MGAISKDYKYALEQDYNYDENLITIDAGRAELFGTSSAVSYVTSSPYLTSNETLVANSINSFAETVTSNGTGDIVKYIINVDGQDKYWDGSAWISSDGSYSQSNFASDVQSQSSTIINDRARIKVKAFIHSATGNTTPYLENINISYDFTGYSLVEDVRSILIGVDTTDLKDEEIVAYIETADTTIDFYVGVQNTLPITNASALKLLRTWSMILASYSVYVYLATKAGKNIAKLATTRYEMLLETLQKVADGTMSLTGLANSGSIEITTEDYFSTFNQGPDINWHVDDDLLSDIADDAFLG